MDFSQALICLLNFATPAQSQDALECQSKRVTIDQSETSGKEIDLDSLVPALRDSEGINTRIPAALFHV